MMDATVSNEMLHTTLLEIRSDVKELKLTKVDLAMPLLRNISPGSLVFYGDTAISYYHML
jgi:hypothetical protein